MDISVTDAKSQLTDLVKRAEAGDDVVLTRHGQPVARIVPIATARTPEERRAFMEAISRLAAAKATPGPCAARSQDFLYDETGMPA
ncbi:MAG: type II toxin-antitoxin system Phd/YefM family antitoxin [Rhodopila sp.]